ncbi:MAG: LamG domain-containing protein [Bacteroidota bacterium]|nr:LamG domain-containing protein [Bacteroidota bacterium]
MKKLNIKPLLIIAVTGLLLSSCYEKFDPASYAPALNIGGYTSSKQIAPSNLVGFWAFNGSLIDSVSNSAGVATGTGFSAGFKNLGMQGADKGYVLFTPGSAITGMHSFTIAYWVNSPVNANGIVGLVNLANTKNFWGNIDMFFENGSTLDAAKFRAHITNGTAETWISKDGLPNIFTKWAHFALSYDATSETFKLYVNGSLIVTQVQTGFGPINFTNSGNLVFGTVQFQTTPSQTSATDAQSWASYLTGQLDEVRIYNKALADGEVNALVLLEGRGK